MELQFIITRRTLSDAAKPIFPGQSGIGVRWVTLKAHSNDFTLLSNIEESNGFEVAEGGSLDIPLAEVVAHSGSFNFNGVYWKNTTAGSNAVVDIIGQREV